MKGKPVRESPDTPLDYLENREQYFKASYFERGHFPRSSSPHTNLSVTEFWCAMFEVNELLPKAKKMTDCRIAEMLRQHFPDRETIQRLFILGKKRLTVNYHRNLFNKGKLVKDYVPHHFSFRYNDRGLKVEGRNGNRVLDGTQIAVIQNMHSMFRNNYPNLRDFAPPYIKNKIVL